MTTFTIDDILDGTIEAGARDGQTHIVTGESHGIFGTACGLGLNGAEELLVFKIKPTAITCATCRQKLLEKQVV